MSDHFISAVQAESDLLHCAAFLAERIKSSDGHSEAMNAIIPLYLAKENVDLAAELSNAVSDPYSRDRLLILVAEKCAELDDEEYGLQLADAIEDDGVRSQALERIALAAAAKGRAERAEEIASPMAHPEFVYAGIAVNHAASGNMAAADAMIEEIEFPTARVWALQQIAADQIEKGNLGEAGSSLDRAAETAIEIEHDEERIRTLCEIGTAFNDAKSSDRAIETFDQARGFAEVLDNSHRDFFLVNCALGFLLAGSGDLADRTLDLVTDKTQMASALVGFARDHWGKDEKDDAVAALEDAYAVIKSQRDNETRDSRTRNAVMTRVAVQFAGFGKSDRAVEIALENQNPDEQISALSQIAQILTTQKEDELARQTVNLIPDDANRLFGLVAMSDAKSKLGEADAATALLDEAAGLSDSVEQLGARSNVLNEIASRYADSGLVEKAGAVSLENLGVIVEIRDESSKAAALAGLSAIFERAGLILGEREKGFLSQLVRKSDL